MSTHKGNICTRVIQLSKKILEAMSLTSQSTPSFNPSPDTAEQAWIWKCRDLDIDFKSKSSDMSADDKAPARSCLFANTMRDAPARRYHKN